MTLVLVIGGAGFIGLHTVKHLVNKGYEVRIFDAFLSPPHRSQGTYNPQHYPYIRDCGVEVYVGDSTRIEDLKGAMANVDYIINLASKVGIGQSMYEPREYTHHNTMGIATLWDLIIKEDYDIKGIVQASTMSIYGEGRYICDNCGDVYPSRREFKRALMTHRGRRGWGPLCPICHGDRIRPAATRETDAINPTSIYALSKYYQECMTIMLGKTYGLNTCVLRYFNVIGPWQSLNNPYTGVCAIFYSAIKNGRKGKIFEDGLQSRDFIHVDDVARANIIALESHRTGIYNIGTGRPTSIMEVAKEIASYFQRDFETCFEITYRYREGDVRHIYADISKASKDLGFAPKYTFHDAIKSFLEWADTQEEFSRLEEYGTLNSYGLLK